MAANRLGEYIAAPASQAVPSLQSARYVRGAMVLLLMVNTVNYMDRSLLNILGEPIKRELKFADWQLGIMTGLAFALIYTTMGLPLARVAERKSRPMVIAGCISVWSGFTVVSGLAANFSQLLLARIGVGIGEAGCTPAATSLIADYVPKQKRASALAFYTMAAPLGGVVGIGLGGLIADAFGWRYTFVAVGLLGFPLGFIVMMFLAEPRRLLSAEAAAAQRSGFAETLRVIRGKPTFWLVTGATSLQYFVGYSHATFVAPFILRNHSAEIATLATSFGLKPVGFVGLVLGFTAGPANMISALMGGRIADRMGVRDIRAYVTVPVVSLALQLPLYVFAFIVGDVRLCFAIIFANALLASTNFGPGYATIQGIVPPHMRATAVAIFGLTTTLVGLGLGPLTVGALSDLFATSGKAGPADGLRYALISSLAILPFVGAIFWKARATIAADMED